MESENVDYIYLILDRVQWCIYENDNENSGYINGG
jgi:hypothetical protein